MAPATKTACMLDACFMDLFFSAVLTDEKPYPFFDVITQSTVVAFFIIFILF